MERTTRVKKRYLEHAFVGVFSSLIVAPMFVVGAGYVDDISANLFNTARVATERAIERMNSDLNKSLQSSPTDQVSQLAIVIESESSNTDSVGTQSFWDRIISSISRFFSSLMWWNGELGMEQGAGDGMENGELGMEQGTGVELGMENGEWKGGTIDPATRTTESASDFPLSTSNQQIRVLDIDTFPLPSPTPSPDSASDLPHSPFPIPNSTPSVAGVSESAMDEKFIQLGNALRAEIYRVEANASRQGNSNFSAIALTQRIDNLANVTISNATMSGSTISNTTISGSTFSGTLSNITDLTTTNFTTTNSTTGNATTTNLAVSGSSYFSALTAGSVPFIGANGLLSQNNSQIFWDSVNSRLGIGTSTPYAKLSVAGEVVGSHFTATTTTDNTFPNLIATNATTTNATSTSFYSTNIFGANSDITNSTSTNSFATTASSTSLFSQFASIVGLNIINSTTTSATSTNFYSTNIFGANSDITNSTSTTSFATTASSTSLFTSNFSLGSISGFLKATAGAVTNALINLTTDITGILGIANGGTNATSFSTDSLTYFDGTRLTSTSSPMVGYITATSTTATSTFAGGLTAGINGLTVLQSGNVGVGTSSPGSLLSIGNTGTGWNFFDNATTTSYAKGIDLKNGGCFAVAGVCVGGSTLTGTIGQLAYFNGTDTAIGTSTLFISTAGNVGIGTTTPGVKLDVQGLIRGSQGTGTGAGGAGYSFVQFGNSTAATENWHVGSEGDGSLRFYNQGFGAGLEKMRITSTGNVGIGTTTPWLALSVKNTNSNGQFVASYDDSNYATLTVDATGDLKFLTKGADIRALSENLWVCDNGACPALTATSTAGNIFVENAVTFGNGFSMNQISTTELGFYNASGVIMVILDDIQ